MDEFEHEPGFAGGGRRVRERARRGLLVALLALLAAAPACGGTRAAGDSAAFTVHPELRTRHEALFLGAGVALLGTAGFLDVTVQPVPPEGLDPATIHWSFDREQVHRHDAGALRPSDLASAASVAYPMAVAFVSQPSGERLAGTLGRSVVYAEAFLLATATSTLIKNSSDRPRPYTYVAASERPGGDAYDVTADEAFQSMPSSHASSSFCGAAFAMTDQLLSRPHAGWLERVGVAFTGGALAGATSSLRVSAGKHFPSDVLAGAAIGTASGVLVPLAHRYVSASGRRGPMPSAHAWLQAAGGLVAGVGAGVLIAQAAY